MKENCFEAESERTCHDRGYGLVMQRKGLGLCLLIFVFLLAACSPQAAEEHTGTSAQSTTQATEPTDTQPQGPVKPSEGTSPPAVTEPTQGTKPTEPKPMDPTEDTEPSVTPEPTDPTDETESPESTEPSEETVLPEITEPTQPPLGPSLGDDELPLVPVG